MGKWREELVMGALTTVIGLVIVGSGFTEGAVLALLGLFLVFSGGFRWAREHSGRD